MTITISNNKANGKEFKDLNWEELDYLNRYFKGIKNHLKSFRKEQKSISTFEVL